jgi:hypothetical protein
MRVGSIEKMFETGYGQHRIITHLKWRIGPFHPEKAYQLFYGIPTGSILC